MIAWSVTRSRREDSLHCWHGSKPPLTQNLPNVDFVYFTVVDVPFHSFLITNTTNFWPCNRYVIGGAHTITQYVVSPQVSYNSHAIIATCCKVLTIWELLRWLSSMVQSCHLAVASQGICKQTFPQGHLQKIDHYSVSSWTDLDSHDCTQWDSQTKSWVRLPFSAHCCEKSTI